MKNRNLVASATTGKLALSTEQAGDVSGGYEPQFNSWYGPSTWHSDITIYNKHNSMRATKQDYMHAKNFN